MTDNEIIKALECCSMGSYPACRDCPYHDDYVNRGCINKRNADIKDLINRQKAEIEKYKGVIKGLEDDLRLAKIETIKDFGKLLIDKIDNGVITHSFDIVDLVADEVERIEKGR